MPRRSYKPDSRAADAALTAIEDALKGLELAKSTNIIVAAEQGFSRIVKVSNTSTARKILPREDTVGILPSGFLAIDLLAALQTEDSVYNLFDSDNGMALVHLPSGDRPKQGNVVIAADYDPSNPLVRIELAANAEDELRDDVAFAFVPGFIELFCEIERREGPPGVQHQMFEQAVFVARELGRLTIDRQGARVQVQRERAAHQRR